MRKCFACAAALVVALFASASVLAQGAAFPNKPIRWIVPYPPGGGTDALGRITADQVSARLGVPVVVTNVAGGSGTVGSDTVRRAEADGYTLLFNASLFLLGKNVVKSTPYDPLEDFTALGRVGDAPILIIAANNIQATNLQELVSAVKANPTRFNMALSGLGAAGHLATLEFMRLADVKLQVVPYKGTAPALADVMGGTVQIMLDAATALIPQTKSGRVRGIAITSAQRSKSAPEIPTTAEAGMPGLTIASWYGVWGPKNLPPAVAQRLAQAVAEAVKTPEFLARTDAAGIVPNYQDPQAFVAFMREDLRRSVALLNAAGFQAE